MPHYGLYHNIIIYLLIYLTISQQQQPVIKTSKMLCLTTNPSSNMFPSQGSLFVIYQFLVVPGIRAALRFELFKVLNTELENSIMCQCKAVK